MQNIVKQNSMNFKTCQLLWQENLVNYFIFKGFDHFYQTVIIWF